jgi:hypothetical protein
MKTIRPTVSRETYDRVKQPDMTFHESLVELLDREYYTMSHGAELQAKVNTWRSCAIVTYVLLLASVALWFIY